MTEHKNDLTQSQRDTMLLEMHQWITGKPLDPSAPPGIAILVKKHDQTLYGENGKNGLVGQSKKLQKWIWMAVGFAACLNLLFAVKLAMLEGGK